MSQTPRLALVTPSTGPEPAAAVLAMLAGFTARGRRVQHFRSRARPTDDGLVGEITGLPGRHLDGWLMDPEVCRRVFVRGIRHADIAIVEGTLDESAPRVDIRRSDRPGRLASIVETLDLPRIALIPAQPSASFHAQRLPREVDALILDGLQRDDDFVRLRRCAETFLGRPVLGAVEALPAARSALASSDRDDVREAVARLGRSFLKWSDLSALLSLGRSRDRLTIDDCRLDTSGECRFRVAYAHDRAFGGYFPDTLESLEALGADLIEFSPLRDEALPEGADLVLIGSGKPEHFAEELGANLSLIAALRAHVCQGRRLYSEGGGTAYLGRSLAVQGRRFPMAGVYPFEAELRSNPVSPPPVSRTLIRPAWLGPRGTIVRGYRSGRWRIKPAPEIDDCPARSGFLTAARDIVFRNNAVGSLIHLHLASLPEVVSAFAGPSRATQLNRV